MEVVHCLRGKCRFRHLVQMMVMLRPSHKGSVNFLVDMVEVLSFGDEVRFRNWMQMVMVPDLRYDISLCFFVNVMVMFSLRNNICFRLHTVFDLGDWHVVCDCFNSTRMFIAVLRYRPVFRQRLDYCADDWHFLRDRNPCGIGDIFLFDDGHRYITGFCCSFGLLDNTRFDKSLCVMFCYGLRLRAGVFKAGSWILDNFRFCCSVCASDGIWFGDTECNCLRCSFCLLHYARMHFCCRNKVGLDLLFAMFGRTSNGFQDGFNLGDCTSDRNWKRFRDTDGNCFGDDIRLFLYTRLDSCRGNTFCLCFRRARFDLTRNNFRDCFDFRRRAFDRVGLAHCSRNRNVLCLDTRSNNSVRDSFGKDFPPAGRLAAEFRSLASLQQHLRFGAYLIVGFKIAFVMATDRLGNNTRIRNCFWDKFSNGCRRWFLTTAVIV